MMNLVLISIALLLIVRYKDDIFGSYCDWVEPHTDERYPAFYESVNEDEDYKNLKIFITNCKDTDTLNQAFLYIIIYQGSYKGLDAEQKVSTLITLYENKEVEMGLLN